MLEPSTLNHTAISAAHALKTTAPIAWESLSHAHAEANKAGSVLIAPTDILAGILLNTGAVSAHHVLQQLGVERNDETLDTLQANRTVPSAMKEILLSNLFGKYRSLVTETVARAKDQLLQELALLQDEIIPQAEEQANASVASLIQCGMNKDEAIDAVRELRESTLAELNAINTLFEKIITNIDERSRSITGPSTMLSTWIWSARKGIYPHVKADAVGNIFSKETQHILCLARESTKSSLVGNEHLLLGLASDDGPGHAALNALSIDPSTLSWLIRNSKYTV